MERRSKRPLESGGDPEPTDSTDCTALAFLLVDQCLTCQPLKKPRRWSLLVAPVHGLSGRIGAGFPEVDLGWIG